MKFYRFNLDTSAEYEAMRAAVDAFLGFPGGNLTCIQPYATAPTDSKGRVLLSIWAETPGYQHLLTHLILMVQAGLARELDQDWYEFYLEPVAVSSGGGGVSSWNDLTDKPSAFTPSAHASTHGSGGSDPITVTWSFVQGKPTFAAVATSGLYSDLSGTPTLATVATTGSAADLTGTLAIARIPTGATSTTVCIGNDSRLSDTRTPTDGTVTDDKIVSSGLSASSLNWAAITAWAASTAYAKGDLVHYLGIAYRRSVAGTSGATFNTANWQQITPPIPPRYDEIFHPFLLMGG